MTVPRDRLVEIDALKAAGILTIVLIHSMRPQWDPSVSALEIWIGHATRFGVPAFLCASGFLYARESPVSFATTRGRLRRILVPYLVASLLAQAFHLWRDEPPMTGTVWMDLLIGASFGPYYYVFVIAILVLATPAFARLSRRSVVALTAASVTAQWLMEIGTFGLMHLTWQIRNPMMWWAYFLIGWSVRLHAEPLARFVARRRPLLAAGCVASAVLLTAASALEGSVPAPLIRTAAWLDVYAILGAIILLSRGAGRSPGWLRFTSDATYTIYLFHLFFVLTVQDLLPLPEEGADGIRIALPWLAGLAGSLLVVTGARAALGDRSREWIGA